MGSIPAASVDIRRAERIVGMMPPKILCWLAAQAQTKKRIAEIGCWRGRTTRALADNCPGIVYAIDTWKGAPGLERDLDYCIEHFQDEDWLINEFRENTKDIRLSKLVPIRATSLQAATYFQDKFFDMIIIDADHEYENVKADLMAWLPKLIPGGLICGDDYNYPPVRQAVKEVFGLTDLDPDARFWGVNLDAA